MLRVLVACNSNDVKCYLLHLEASDPDHHYFLTEPPFTLDTEIRFLSQHFAKRVEGFQLYGPKKAVSEARVVIPSKAVRIKQDFEDWRRSRTITSNEHLDGCWVRMLDNLRSYTRLITASSTAQAKKPTTLSISTHYGDGELKPVNMDRIYQYARSALVRAGTSPYIIQAIIRFRLYGAFDDFSQLVDGCEEDIMRSLRSIIVGNRQAEPKESRKHGKRGKKAKDQASWEKFTFRQDIQRTVAAAEVPIANPLEEKLVAVNSRLKDAAYDKIADDLLDCFRSSIRAIPYADLVHYYSGGDNATVNQFMAALSVCILGLQKPEMAAKRNRTINALEQSKHSLLTSFRTILARDGVPANARSIGNIQIGESTSSLRDLLERREPRLHDLIDDLVTSERDSGHDSDTYSMMLARDKHTNHTHTRVMRGFTTM